jgi:uncharacterized membrane-anchored protein
MTFLLLVFLATSTVAAQPDRISREIEALPWQDAPAIGSIASVARITLTNDLRFLDAPSTSRFLVLNENPPRNNQYTLAPRGGEWFAIFGFDPSGYVRDDESLDPDQLLNILRQQNEAGIIERRRLGLPILRLEGWAVTPHYDLQTRRLEWGTRLIGDDGRTVVNYAIRLLGRSGVMSAILVSDPQNLNDDILQFRNALRGFDFIAGERYAEFRQGDRVAEYGLAALIVGGAAAAAAKSGLLKTLGKFIGIGALALIAAVGAFFRKLSRKNRTQ